MNELVWHLSRSAGVVAIALMTVVLVLGLITSGQRLRTTTNPVIDLAGIACSWGQRSP
ncbi:MAG: hypothetical protein WA892_14495 [Ornithinimicrobium sp.]